MPVRRKVFRIEEMMRSGTLPPAVDPGRAMATTAAADLAQTEIARISAELAAVVVETERSTHRILAAAEEIDQAVKTLAASVKSEQERGLADEIQDQVMRVMEACNYQDLSGQRVGKVLAALGAMTARPAGAGTAVPTQPPCARALLNGPKLDGAPGHVTQSDIDLMFGS